MRVLFVTVPSHPQSVALDKVFSMEPLALEYLGAGIKKDHDVKIFDLRIERDTGLKEVLESFKPHIIGCGALTPEVYSAKNILAEAKKICPEILTVIGGHHATVKPGDFFDDTIDVVVMREAVDTFKKICECHEKQKGFADIENVYYRKNKSNGEMVLTRKKDYPPLDSLPFPDRTLTSHIRQKYFNYLSFGLIPNAAVRGSVGCLYRCKFCAVSSIRDYKVYKRSIDLVIEELASITEPCISWVDDELLLDPDRAIQLAREIAKAGIKKRHAFFGRSDTIIKNPQAIEEWAKVGLDYVLIGFESFRESDLKKIRKGNILSINKKAVKILHDNNVKIRGSFIVQPDFEKKDFRHLVRYVKELELDRASYSILTPYPGTDLYEEEKDNLITHNYNLFEMAHTVFPTKLPLKQFYKEYGNLIFKKAVPFKERIKLLMEMKPADRKEFIRIGKAMLKKVKNAHQLYN